MKKSLVLGLGMSLLLFGFGSKADADEMQRLYNPNSGEHFYTKNMVEKNVLVKAGWIYEGVGWYTTKAGYSMNVFVGLWGIPNSDGIFLIR